MQKKLLTKFNIHLLEKLSREWAQREPTSTLVQFCHSVVSDSSQPHGPQLARPPCPSPTPRVYSNSSPLSR